MHIRPEGTHTHAHIYINAWKERKEGGESDRMYRDKRKKKGGGGRKRKKSHGDHTVERVVQAAVRSIWRTAAAWDLAKCLTMVPAVCNVADLGVNVRVFEKAL